MANFLSIDASIIEDYSYASDAHQNIISITLKRDTQICPHCKSTFNRIKDYQNRKIKHSLFLGKETLFIIKNRRYECLECGKTFVGKNDFAPKRSRLSYETIYQILRLSMEWNSTTKSVASICHVSDTTIQNIFDKYVNPERKVLPRILSIDECFNCHLFNDPYSCILFDFERMKIVDIIEDRSKWNLAKYFNKVKPDERHNVKYVVIDMWDSYKESAETYFPNAMIAVDSFHVMQNITRAVDKIRCKVMGRYETNSNEYYLLKKYNDLLFEDPRIWEEKQENKRFKKYLNKRQMLDMMCNLDNDLNAAHEFYINYRRCNQILTYEEMDKIYDDFAFNIRMSAIEEFIPVLTALQNWKPYILNSFKYVDGRRLSNGPIEGFNSCFKKTLTVSNGYANFERFRAKVMFCYNKELKMKQVSKRINKIPSKKRGKYAKKNRQTE